MIMDNVFEEHNLIFYARGTALRSCRVLYVEKDD